MTRDDLIPFFDIVDADKRAFAIDTIDEYIFFRNQIADLMQLPLIRVSKSDPTRQMSTPAAKMIKEYSQVLDAKRATLLRILYRVENSAADELLAKLAEFE